MRQTLKIAMLCLLTVCMYAMAAIFFPWEWLKEQRSAFLYAWLNTFAEAKEHSKKMWGNSR